MARSSASRHARHRRRSRRRDRRIGCTPAGPEARCRGTTRPRRRARRRGTSAATVGPPSTSRRVMPSSCRPSQNGARGRAARSSLRGDPPDGHAGGIARRAQPSAADNDRRHVLGGCAPACASGDVRKRASSTMRRGEASASPGSRQVSSGSSSATVPRPTRMASARARSRWREARASGPVTQRGAPSPRRDQAVAARRRA